MDNNHISFEEMAEYIFSQKMDSESLKTAARINYHVMHCESCRKIYSALIEIEEKIQDYKNAKDFISERYIKLYNAIKLLNKKLSSSSVMKIINDAKDFTAFKIQDMQNGDIIGMNGFYNPQLVTVMKSYSDDEALKEQKSELKTSVKDNNGNKVRLGLDGTITIYASTETCREGQGIALIPENEDGDIVLKKLEKYDDNTLYVNFFDVSEGSYETLLIDADLDD